MILAQLCDTYKPLGALNKLIKHNLRSSKNYKYVRTQIEPSYMLYNSCNMNDDIIIFIILLLTYQVETICIFVSYPTCHNDEKIMLNSGLG